MKPTCWVWRKIASRPAGWSKCTNPGLISMVLGSIGTITWLRPEKSISHLAEKSISFIEITPIMFLKYTTIDDFFEYFSIFSFIPMFLLLIYAVFWPKYPVFTICVGQVCYSSWTLDFQVIFPNFDGKIEKLTHWLD